ncbi:dATP/dGTP pyrophosphohydrolase domain-containing protein, partial [Citrobacter sp. TBCS-14]|uniref:dATP/dGTP pyrophosphohydrolase domain-containing protein n=1 Tax=Citrobacter sp. TBCS-14 TaxID=2576409 RepID=UPI003513E437
MQFLLWDAQRRAGISDEQITLAMVDKLAINKQREWPEPKDGEPRLHIKAQPAPVVPDEKPMPEASKMYAIEAVAAIAEVRGWNACRDAMLQAGNSPVTPDGYILVPIVPTEDMIINGFESVPDPHF